MRRRLLLSLTVCLLAAVPAVAAGPVPRIVNGSTTNAFPTTGALLSQDVDDPARLDGLCTGTLIGCHTFLTAAHCVCPERALDATSCLLLGTTDPATLRVFLPNAGILAVESVAIHPLYSFAERGDSAVVRLVNPVGGIAPAAINRAERPPLGTHGVIVGFGTTGGPPFLASDYGVKRQGTVTTGACADDVDPSNHVCWSFDGEESSTCSGDSGGPLFVDLGHGPVVAGITSGGDSFSCEPPDQVFDTDVYLVRDWIDLQLANDTVADCGALPALGSSGASTVGSTGGLSAATPEMQLDFSVPAGTRTLRVALNGQEVSGAGFERIANDFDLVVRADASAAVDCLDTSPGVYGTCEISAPSVGAWHASSTRLAGMGNAQLTVTMFTARGDFNCDARVKAADLVALANLIAADAPLPCPAAEAEASAVDLDPLIAAIFR